MNIDNIGNTKEFILFDAIENFSLEFEDLEEAIAAFISILYVCSSVIEEDQLLLLLVHAGFDIEDFKISSFLAYALSFAHSTRVIEILNLNELRKEEGLMEGIGSIDSIEVEEFKQSARQFIEEWSIQD